MTRRWLFGKIGAFRGAIAALACVAVFGGGCGKSPHGNNPDTGARSDSKPPNGGDVGHADGSLADRPADVPAPCSTTAAPKSKGASESCACDSDCRTGFCADGVCCDTACTDTCKACNLPSSLGVCSPVPAGVQPSNSSQCPADKALTCGQDGTCDGAGACRKYVSGTECKPGTCAGDSITGGLTCDGNGSCSQSSTNPCYPYTCDPTTNLCATECTTNSQCAAGQACIAGSCGKKLNGAAAKTSAECLSGFVASDHCCNVACDGPCVSCDLPGSIGRCKPVDFGLPDPGNQCPATLASTCGTTGLCDGSGSCAIFPANTPCASAACSGGVLAENAQACDGKGTCQSANLVDCSPYMCSNGACNGSCTSDNDCAPGTACVPTQVRGMTTGLCNGKKANGQTCADASECNSDQCVDGYCCESSCQGACRSCGLPATLGQCVEVAAGAADPHGTCADQGKTSCGTNGMCDGSGACQKYPVGYTCGSGTCVLGSYTPAPACNASGQCVAPASISCNPYVCNGQVCYDTCTSDNSQCAPPRICDTTKASCGPKPLGAQCGAGTDCQSGNCAQGVCCNATCTGACMACNLPATLGYCTAVADGAPDPQGLCPVTAQSSCGTTGLCKSGKCAYVAQGNNCKASSCPTNSSETPASTCDGLGTCLTPANVSCGTFICSSAACENICATDNDCVPPNTCVGNSCGKKPAGQSCASGPQCASGFCTEGVCCNTACSDAATGGLCMSCKVSGKVGTCSPVPVGGADPKKLCVASNALGGDCSNAGTCNGAGACSPWSTAQGCRLASCTGTTFTAAANCDGNGSCPAPTTQSCDPYVCSTTSPSCKTTCTADTDCDKQTCLKVTNTCGTTLPNGQACKANTDCASGFCTSEGVCCNSACTGACQSCAISGKKGTCSNIAASGTPRDTTTCPANPPCGDTGSCDGNGGCQLTKAGTTCGSASCAPPVSGTLSGGTVSQSLAAIPAGACDGKGGCTPGNPVSCQTFQCNAANATCKTSCTSTTNDCNSIAPNAADSIGGNTCINGTCQLKTNGSSCGSGFACASGNCVDGVCCGSPSCGTCQACNIANAQGNLDGNCRLVAAGTTEPHNLCSVTANTSCGTDGKCTATGACEQWNGSACTPASGCADSHDAINTGAGTGKCNGSGTCTPGTPVACPTGYMCVSGACASSCTVGNASTNCDTADNFSCIGGVCTKIGVGQSCTSAAGCSTGSCVDGVCCTSASCPVCSSCNLSGSVGNCSNVPANTADGTCVGACPTATSASGLCNGNGSCLGTTTCQPGYTCSGGICATSCTTNSACASGYGCFNGSCLKNPGITCSANTDCGSGFCVQGVCCNNACSGSCQTCTATPGTCTPTASGGAPRDPSFCPVTATCGDTGKCNGTGGCQLATAGTTCNVNMSCTGGTQNGGSSTCDGSGNCIPPTSVQCSPNICGANSCATSCSTDTQCAAGFACASNGTCKKANGQTCSANADCASGECVSNGTFNICCATGCADVTCGNTAFCKTDGSACTTHAAGETCGSGVATCSSDNLSSIGAPTCGGGQCVTPASVACNPGYLCSGAGLCATSCTTDASCNTSAGYSCIGGHCAKEANGQSCTTSANCASGSYCISDGTANGKVCCAVNCIDATCGNKAVCTSDGSGCQTHQGDPCGKASCGSGNHSSIAAGSCDGAGNCSPSTPVACTTGYLCSGGKCAMTCATDGNCDGTNGYTCSGGQCKNLSGLGGPCQTSGDCSAGTCVSDGSTSGKICCATTCTDSPPCGTMPACAPGGAVCQIYASGLPCGTAGCSSDNLSTVSIGTCDGQGGCTQPPTSCNGYLCSGGSCLNSCTDDSACDTIDNYHCDVGSGNCLPQ